MLGGAAGIVNDAAQRAEVVQVHRAVVGAGQEELVLHVRTDRAARITRIGVSGRILSGTGVGTVCREGSYSLEQAAHLLASRRLRHGRGALLARYARSDKQ